MRIHKDVISGIVILLFCAVGALSTSQLPPPSAEEWAGPSTLPYITLGATALCGVLLVITGIARRNADRASRSFNLDPKVLAFYVFWVCYMAAMVWLGDLISGMNRQLNVTVILRPVRCSASRIALHWAASFVIGFSVMISTPSSCSSAGFRSAEESVITT